MVSEAAVFERSGIDKGAVMRSSQIRHLLSGLGRPTSRTSAAAGLLDVGESSAVALARPPGELSPRDEVAFLLHVDAEIEHCLMVQYLYAAYSLGGPQVPAHRRELVRGWQEVILGIAKEEMGHFVSIQNVLRLIGAPLNLTREDFPWDVPFYPFPFMLEPLTLDSLAKYVFAESAVDWTGALAEEIHKRVEKSSPTPHRVSELFDRLIPLVKDPSSIPDDAFQARTYPFQANWAEWGRGYQGGHRGNATGANPPATPDVLVTELASRDDAANALHQIAEQGEAPHASSPDAPSHFARFVKIYLEMKETEGEGWSAARPVAVNPYIGEEPAHGGACSLITNPTAVMWAQLHNVRYRMLLAFLAHTFVLDGGLSAAGAATPRGVIINATFGEMYNLRAIALLLMQMPLDESGPSSGLAGPPFQIPYTLDPPLGESNRWRLHLDLLEASDGLVTALLALGIPAQRDYLVSLREADGRMRLTTERILAMYVDKALT